MTTWLIDTGPLVAFFDVDSADHAWAAQQWDLAALPLWTCEPVFTEAIHLLRRARVPRSRVLELIRRGIVQVRFSLEREIDDVIRLLDKYSDQDIDFADACLIRMAELKRDCRVFTLDSDFRMYRRFDRQVIPVLMPH